MAAGLQDVRLHTTVIQNSVAFLRMLFANRVAQLAKDPDAFWAELEQGEREGWLSSGVISSTAAGRKRTP